METKILFNLTKKEVASPATNMKKILKNYKQQYKIGLNKDEIQFDLIKDANLMIFGNP